MSRVWLAALGAAAVIACGDDSSGGEPDDLFPEVAGIYAIQGEFDEPNPDQRAFSGTVVIEQASLESSLLTGSANITIVSATEGDTDIVGAELLDAAVTLAGVVSFTVTQGDITWDFIGERAGDVLEGNHTIVQGSETSTGTWSGER